MIDYVVLLSGGVSSWAAGRRIVDQHGPDGVVALFTDTLVEDADTYAFLRASADDLGCRFVWSTEGRDIWQVFRDERMLGNSRMDPCSRSLKRRPARAWVEEHGTPGHTAVVLGIDWTELHRFERAERFWKPYRCAAPLTEPPYTEKDALLADAEARGLPIPGLYRRGAPHANCGGGCVKAGRAHWAWLLREYPDRFAEWERNEQAMRDFLAKDVAMLTDRRGGERKPLTLAQLRAELEVEDDDPQLSMDWGGCGCMID